MSESVSGATLQGELKNDDSPAQGLVSARQGRRVLIIVENLPCPFDRRV